MGKKNKIAAKKNPISEALRNSGNSRLMHNLKTVNACLVKEAAECRKEIERLRIQLTSLVAEGDIFHHIQHDVFALVVSFSLRESASRATAEMAAASDSEKILRNKIEAVAMEANAKEIELLVLAKEKEDKKKNLTELKERIGSMKEINECGRQRRNLVCSVAVMTPFIAVAGAAALTAFYIIFKK